MCIKVSCELIKSRPVLMAPGGPFAMRSTVAMVLKRPLIIADGAWIDMEKRKLACSAYRTNVNYFMQLA